MKLILDIYGFETGKNEKKKTTYLITAAAAAAAANSLQSCPTLCDPIDGSPSGSPVPGILQASYANILVLTPPYGFFFNVQIFISSVTSFIGHFVFLLHKVDLFSLFTKIMSSGTLLCI